MLAEGVDFVFNTPNDKSRPGYLKMGWEEVGRVPITVRPRSPMAAYRMTRARTAAGKWSRPTTAGIAASDALADDVALTTLLALGRSALRPGHRSHRRSPALALPLRAARLSGRRRARRRGRWSGRVPSPRIAAPPPRRSCARSSSPHGDRRLGARLVHDIAHQTRADYLIGTTTTVVPRTALPLPLVRQGPILTWHAVTPTAQMPALKNWSLTMGDVELF